MKLPHKLFYQTEKYEGRPDIFRQFDELDASLIRQPAFTQMIDAFVRLTGIHMLNTPVEVHQIRIVSQEGIPGNPSPEGIHRDGCHYLGIFVIDRHGIDDGANSIHLDKESPPIFQAELEPGQMLLCNDEYILINFDPTRRPSNVTMINIAAGATSLSSPQENTDASNHGTSTSTIPRP